MADCPICGKDMAVSGSMGIMYRAKATGRRSSVYVCPDCGQLCGEVEFGSEKAYEKLSAMKENISDKTAAEYVQTVLGEYEGIKNIKSEAQKKEEQLKSLMDSVMITTEGGFDGFKVVEYKNVISGEYMLVSEILGEGTVQTAELVNAEFSKKMYEAKQKALENMKRRCCQIECNAIIGINYNCVVLSKSMIGVTANGTAVKIEKA